MLSKRSLQLLSAVERQSLWHAARRRGQCVRCFHASIRRAAEGSSSGKSDGEHQPAGRSGREHELAGKGASAEESGRASPKARLVEDVQARPTPPDSFDKHAPHQPTKPASTRDRKRHQKAEMISEQVQMIHRDHPSPSFADANPNTSPNQPPPTAQTPNPEGSAMGENDPVSREGPTGQGVAKAVATDEDVQDTSGLARGARRPREGVEEPATGGVAVVGTPGQGRQTARLTEEGEGEEEEGMGEEDEGEGPVQTRRRSVDREVVEPSTTLTKEDLLHAGYETSTPAGGDMRSTIADHIRVTAHRGETPLAERSPQQLAVKMMHGQLVHFRSAAEKAATVELAQRIAEVRARRYASQRKLSSDEVQPEAKNYSFASLPETTRRGIIDRLGRGIYDSDGMTQGKTVQRFKSQPILQGLALQAMKNETYTTRDRDRFLRKVQSLLPRAASTTTGPRKGGQQQRRAQA